MLCPDMKQTRMLPLTVGSTVKHVFRISIQKDKYTTFYAKMAQFELKHVVGNER